MPTGRKWRPAKKPRSLIPAEEGPKAGGERDHDAEQRDESRCDVARRPATDRVNLEREVVPAASAQADRTRDVFAAVRAYPHPAPL